MSSQAAHAEMYSCWMAVFVFVLARISFSLNTMPLENNSEEGSMLVSL